MTYPEFRNAIFQNVEELLPQGVTVKLLDVEKQNNTLRHGILFTKDNVPFSSTIYLEPFFKAFKGGKDICKLAEELLCCYKEDKTSIPESVFNLADFETAKENIFAKLIHLEENETFLKDVPYQTFLDFAIVTYFEVDHCEMYQGTVLLKDNLVKNWEVTKEELLLWALQNTKDKKKVIFRDMAEVLANHLTETDKNILLHNTPKMYVLTNEQKFWGAILICFPEVLQMICKMIGENYYLLPSSVHEWIIIPESNADECNYLRQIVQEINRSEVLPEEMLSNEVYFYESDTCSIHICQST